MKQKYQTNDLFFSKKHNKIFRIDRARFIPGYKNNITKADEYLYNCEYIDQRNDTQHVNYYESRIDSEAIMLDDKNQCTQILKVLFGSDEA